MPSDDTAILIAALLESDALLMHSTLGTVAYPSTNLSKLLEIAQRIRWLGEPADKYYAISPAPRIPIKTTPQLEIRIHPQDAYLWLGQVEPGKMPARHYTATDLRIGPLKHRHSERLLVEAAGIEHQMYQAWKDSDFELVGILHNVAGDMLKQITSRYAADLRQAHVMTRPTEKAAISASPAASK